MLVLELIRMFLRAFFRLTLEYNIPHIEFFLDDGSNVLFDGLPGNPSGLFLNGMPGWKGYYPLDRTLLVSNILVSSDWFVVGVIGSIVLFKKDEGAGFKCSGLQECIRQV